MMKPNSSELICKSVLCSFGFLITVVIIISIAGPIVSVDEAEVNEAWKSFKHERQNSIYRSKTDDDAHRYQIFKSNYARIKAHNSNYTKNQVKFQLGINKFADRKPEEIKQLLGAKVPRDFKEKADRFGKTRGATLRIDESVPESLDWRTSGLVSPVKEQEQCGSCWTFSAVGSLEGQFFKKMSKSTKMIPRVLSLSTQQLLDCTDNADGCGGGWMGDALESLKTVGIELDRNYPYTAEKSECKASGTERTVARTAYVLPPGSAAAFKSALATVGPISVALDSTINFVQYSSGAIIRGGFTVRAFIGGRGLFRMSDPTCNPSNPTHAVLAVGYGVDAEYGEEYWLIKNSWGTRWGENGYVRVAVNNDCGISSWALYPEVN